MNVAIAGAHIVIGSACSGKRLEETVFEAAAGALEDAGITRTEVDSVVLGASDELDGRSISSMLTSAPAGGLLKDLIKTTDSSLHALALGAMRVQSGVFDVTLVVSWSMTSETSVEKVQWTALDPFISRDIGLIDPIASGVMANAYLARFGRNVDDLDNRATQKRSGLTKNLSHSSQYVSYPLRSIHVAPFVDCAVAIVLVSRNALGHCKLRNRPIWISGLGWATDQYSLAERGFYEWPALKRATSEALKRASCHLFSLEDFEVEDYTVLHEALAIESIGLTAAGTGFEYLTNRQKSLVNQHCNGFQGHPFFCAGLWRAAKTFRRMADTADDTRAMVHGTAGIAAQGHIVAIFKG